MVLRGAGIAIAIAAAVDPVLSVERSTTAPVVLANLTRGPIDDARETLRGRTDAHVIERSASGNRVPCSPQHRCLIVADGSIAAELPPDIPAPLLLIGRDPAGPNVRVRSAAVASPHASAASSARIELESVQMSGRRTTVTVRDGEATVGSSVHHWTTDGRATIDVAWWPMSAGPRLLHVEASSDAEETTITDNTIDVAVEVSNQRWPVLVFDARPSWTSTFVRRALEDDPRFVVEHRARVAPALSASTPAGRLDVRALNAASVLIVGGPDALNEDETSLIERFARRRGGTVVLLPERLPQGPGARLFQTAWREQLTDAPQSIGPLRASEILHTADPPLGSTVLGAHDERPSIVVMPTGEGAVLVAGAMDAWRFREDGSEAAFDRFWRSIAAQSAANSAALQVTFEGPPAIAGTRHVFRVTSRSMETANITEATAIARCGAGTRSTAARAVRLWPSGSGTDFVGEIAIGAESPCEVEVSIGESRVISGIAVAQAASAAIPETLASLERSVKSAGGTIAREDDLGAHHLADLEVSRHRAPLHPMRSPWWIVPFAFCLSAEWWMRRRDGHR